MGRSASLGEFARKLSASREAFEASAQPALRKAAAEGKRLTDVQYRAVTGGDFKLSNWTPGPTFRAGYEFLSAESFSLGPRDPRLDVGIGPHPIGAGVKRSSGRRSFRGKRNQAGLVGPVKGRRNSGFVFGAGYGHPVRGPVMHPGERPREPFNRARVSVRRRVPEVYSKERVDALVRPFA
jgi:hypothetical protein